MSYYSDLMNSVPKLGFYSSAPANYIDRAYLSEPKSWLSQAWLTTKVRIAYLFFIALLAIDLTTSGLLALSYAFRSLFVSENIQDKQLNQQKEYASSFGRSLYALLASPIGLIYPKLTVFYFTTQKKPSGVFSGGQLHHAPNADIVTPKTKEELQELILKANREKLKIIPLGAGKSQGRQFLPKSDEKTLLIDLSKFNSVEVHEEKKEAIVGAGALWSDVQSRANDFSLAVKVMQASNIFSVGGSIGTNIHGWDYKSGMISNTIQSMDIITPTGEFKTLTPDDDLFHQITSGFGLFGIIYRVNLKLADNENLQRQTVDVPIDQYHDYFNANLKDDEHTRLHLFRLNLDPKNLLKTGFTETYVKVDDTPRLKTENYSLEAANGTRLQRVLVNIARRFGWLRKLWWDNEHQEYLNNHPMMTTNEIMQAPINAMFNTSVSEAEWLQEFFLPGEKLAEFLNEFGSLLTKNNVSLLNATVRFVKQNNKSPMSYAYDADRFAVVICFNQSLRPSDVIKAKKWLRKAQNMAVEKGGTYYLPYQDVSSPEDFAKSYPRAEEVQTLKEAIDPNQVLTSGFHQKYLVPKPPVKNHARWVMTNPEARESFKGFVTNILQRVDADKLYSLLDDILEYCDTHEEIYAELCQRLPEISPSTLDDIQRKLHSLSDIKKDLTEQAHYLLPDDLKEINGIVEIGSPGRYVNGFRQHYMVKGKIISVNESQSIADYIDAGSLHPYDEFVPLNCNAIDFSKIKDKSADLITCYIGLHHFNEKQLDHFLNEVHRILRDGGHFILDDHDIIDEKTDSMAHFAHLVFNAVNGVSVKDEVAEIRDFKPISYWREQLTQHGLSIATAGPDLELIRQGDPTRNRMIISRKATLELSHTLIENRKETRPLSSTNLGNWRNNPTSGTSLVDTPTALFQPEEETKNDSLVPDMISKSKYR